MNAAPDRRGLFGLLRTLLAAAAAIWAWNAAALALGVVLPLATPGRLAMNPAFAAIALLAALVAATDPVAEPFRRWLRDPRRAALWLLLVLGGVSLGFFIWTAGEPARAAKLVGEGRLSRLDRAQLRQDVGLALVLLHAAWIALSRWSPAARERGADPVARGAAVLSLVSPLGLLALFPAFAADEEWMTLAAIAYVAVVVGYALPLGGPSRASLLGARSPAFGALLAVAIALYVGVLGFLGVRKLDVYAGNGDFPVYLQPLWTALHGRFFEINWYYTPPGVSISWFGEHFDPIYFLLLPLYGLDPDPRPFVWLQALAVGLAAWPLYEIGRARLRHGGLALAFALAYLANPLIARGLLFDFHAEALEPVLLFTTFLAIDRRRPLAAAASALLLLSCKEDASLYLVAFGAYFALAERRPRVGAALLFGGAVWLALSVGVVIPYFHHGSGAAYDTFQRRYPLFGNTPSAAFLTAVTHPLLVVRLLFDSTAIKDWARVLLPVAGVSALHWSGWVLFTLPTLELFLSQFRFMKELALHYPWFLCPMHFLAAILVLGRLRGARPAASASRLATYLLVFGVLFHYFLDPRPPVTQTFNWHYNNAGPLGRHFDPGCYHVNDHDRAIRAFLGSAVAPGESLAVDHRFSHDVADRFVLRQLWDTGDVDRFVLDARVPSLLVVGRDLVRVKERLLPMLEAETFGVRRYDDGLALFERGAPADGNLRVAQDVLGLFEAEDRRGDVGETVVDGEARNKRARRVSSGAAAGSVVLRTPAQRFAAGAVELAVRARVVGAEPSSPVLRVRIVDGTTGEVRAEQTFPGARLSDLGRYAELSLRLALAAPSALSAQVLYAGHGELYVDALQWTSAATGWDDLRANLAAQE